jgi:hypothetical protein
VRERESECVRGKSERMSRCLKSVRVGNSPECERVRKEWNNGESV